MMISEKMKKAGTVEENTNGAELVETVLSATGLPEDLVRDELVTILNQAGHSEHDVTLEQLREAMISYLESLNGDLAEAEALETVEPSGLS